MEKLTKKKQKSKNPDTFFSSWRMLFNKQKDGTLGEVFEDWKWILKYSARYKPAIAFYVVAGVLASTLSLISSVAGKYLIDIITGYDISRLWILVVVMVASSVIGVAFNSATNRVSAKLSIYIHNDIQADIFDKVLDADWLSLKKFSNGDVLNRINSDMGVVSGNAVSWLPSIVIALYYFVSTFGVLFYYDPWMAWIALGSAPVLMLLSRYMLRNQRIFSQDMKEKSSDLMAFQVETFYGVDTIKSFGLCGSYGEKLRRLQKSFRDSSLRYNWFQISASAMMNLAGSVVQFVAFGYCLFRLWSHAITFGTMTLFLQQRGNLSKSFESIVSIVPTFLNCAVSAHRIRELVELKKEVHMGGEALPEELQKEGLGITFEEVCFGYEEGRDVLQKAEFKASPGEIVALVGPSGEGKTTMLRLILGLIYPGKGRAFLTATTGQELLVNADTRYIFSYVPQGNSVFSGTIAQNLRMVKEDATDEEIKEVLEIACAWDFVKNRPEGIDTFIGEQGSGLSEGQAQRLAIARALLRDAPILLLDEATSALDIATERRVLRNIMKQKPNKTCIVTTHRPSVLSMCQRVYQVGDGRLRLLDEKQCEQLVMEF